ncbi:unnamed protein product [Trifolium pratense]|uniref:Uncharacterized protein n=1 Tax=Trifolium pratense TaxID=57577 RepID=A0ACB0KJY3_TRIPR|nr:unnamed protein product [Trifolium pratense]
MDSPCKVHEKNEVTELACPLGRGQDKGWTVVKPVRDYLNEKKRSCMQDDCSFVGNYNEFKKHMRAEHRSSNPFNPYGYSSIADMDMFCTSQNVIKSLKPMNCLRSYASVVEFNGQIYVSGGGDDRVWFDSGSVAILKIAKGSRGRCRIASRQYRLTSYPLARFKRDICEDMCQNKGSKALDKKECEDVTCSVCMEYPHNAVLLCSSHDKGCRPYMCGTSLRHSHCLDHYKKAYTKVISVHNGQPVQAAICTASTAKRSRSISGQMLLEYLSASSRCGQNL